MTEQPTVADLLARARELAPTLRERGPRTEELRRIPDETIEDFRRAGFIRVSQPRRFGGLGHGLDAINALAFETGRACGASGWLASLLPSHNFMVGYFSLEAQEEYFATSFDTLCSTGTAVAKFDAQPERGGWRIRDSHFRFSSGSDVADWVMLMVQQGMFLLPRSDFRVLDDWYSSGMRGSGSKSVVIEDAWVPPHRFIAMDDLAAGRAPGIEADPENPYLRAPASPLLGMLIAAPVIGMAQGVVDLYEERVTKRIDIHTLQPAKEGPGNQLRFAEACAGVEAASLVLRSVHDDLVALGEADRPTGLEERARIVRNGSYSSQLAVRAGDLLIEAGDASAMLDANPMNRMARDLRMAALHMGVVWDEPARTFSRVRWGMTPTSVRIH